MAGEETEDDNGLFMGFVHPDKLTISGTEALNRLKAIEEAERERLIKNREINKNIPSIMINLGDGTHLKIAPSMVIERIDWKFELDGATLQYRHSPELWVERIKPNGVVGLWRKGADIK